MSSLGLSAPLRFQIPKFWVTKNPTSYRGEVNPAVPPCLVLSAVYRPPPRRGLLDHPEAIVLPRGSKASSGTCLHRLFTIRRLSGAARQLRTTPRQHLNVCRCFVANHTRSIRFR